MLTGRKVGDGEERGDTTVPTPPFRYYNTPTLWAGWREPAWFSALSARLNGDVA